MQVKWPDEHPKAKWIIPIATVVVYSLPCLLFLVAVVLSALGFGSSAPQQAVESITDTQPIITESGSVEESNSGFFAALALMAALLLFTVAECIIVHANSMEGRRTFSRRVMLLNKLGMIPFFTVAGIVVLMLGMFVVFPGGAWLLAILPLLLFFGWLIMMAGSAWGFAYVVGLRNDGVIGTGLCVFFIAMQCLFCADVVIAAIIFAAYRKYDLGRAVPPSQLPPQAPPRVPQYPPQAPQYPPQQPYYPQQQPQMPKQPPQPPR